MKSFCEVKAEAVIAKSRDLCVVEQTVDRLAEVLKETQGRWAATAVEKKVLADALEIETAKRDTIEAEMYDLIQAVVDCEKGA